MKIPDLKLYYWLLYPLAVVGLVIFSLNFLTGGESGAWAQILAKQHANSENQKTLARLNAKLKFLQQVNPAQVSQDFSQLLKAMPEKKHFDLVVNELKYSAASAGVVLESYKAGSTSNTDDFSLSAVFIVPDYSAVQKLLSTLHTTLPLVSVTSTKFAGTSMTLELISAYSPLQPSSVKIDEPLPEYTASLAKVKSDLASFQLPVVPESPIASSSGNASSPLSTDPFGSLPGSN